MGRSRFSAPILIAALLALAGCAAVDSFGSRALTYNRQAATIKEQQLMLNVMRAAYREPLQFTAFTQVSGQSSASGTLGFTLPFNPSPPTFGHADTASPSATVAGTQTFTVATLDTQEFYQGILSPIPITSIDYYIEQGFPKTLLLTLMVSRIEIRVPGRLPLRFYNDYYDNHFATFEAMIDALVALGLSSEVVRDVSNIGPPLTAAQIADVRALAPVIGPDTLLQRFTAATDPDLTPAERAALAGRGVSEYFRLQSTTSRSRFCVAPNLADDASAAAALIAAGVLPAGTTVTSSPPAAELCGAPDYLRRKAAERRGYAAPEHRLTLEIHTGTGKVTPFTFSITFTVRSVEGIIYYLGELARDELGIGVTQLHSVPEIQTAIGTDRLFWVQRNCTGYGAEIGARYGGAGYCIAVDPSGRDRSSEVMEIVLQLLALNTSAKTLPAPSVISILAP